MKITQLNRKDDPVLDPERVIADMECDVGAYREIAAVFLEELEPTYAAMNQADIEHEVDRVISMLHEVANSLGIIGAVRGARIVRSLEADLCEDPNSWGLGEAIAQARVCLAECAVALQSWLDRSNPDAR